MELVFGLFFSFIFGLLIGSFINCWAWRLYQEESLMNRSYCPQCRQQIRWHDNIPLISFVLLKGRCRDCQKPISWQYPAVEILTALLFAVTWFFFGAEPWFFLKSLITITILILVLIFDARWFLIPVNVLIGGFFIVALFGYLASPLGGLEYLSAFLLSALVGALFFALQYLLTSGRGVGEGDIWFGVFLGAAFASLKHLAVALILAYFIGASVSIFLVLSGKKKWGSRLPLGVFLVIGTLLAWFFGEALSLWYLSLF